MASTFVADDTAAQAQFQKELSRIWPEYKASLEAGDLERWLALWTDDGVQMPDGVPQRVGKADIRAMTRQMLDAYHLEFGFIDSQEARVAGDWAYSRGIYTATFIPKAGGKPLPVNGKFLTVFARQPDGSWRIHRDCFNSNVTP